jgi:hypothetical protein
MPAGTDTGMLMTLALANGESALCRQQSTSLINTSSGLLPARSVYRPMATKEGNRRCTKLAGIKREFASSTEEAG